MESKKSTTSEVPEARVLLWCIPRTVSTALTKCLNSIDGITIWLEPFGFSSLTRTTYLRVTQEELPIEYQGNEDKFAQAAEFVNPGLGGATLVPDRLSYPNVKNALETTTGRYIFVKDQSFAMSHDFKRFLPAGFKHTFFIRDPRRVFVSFRKAMYQQLAAAGALEGKTLEDFDIEVDDINLLSPGSFYQVHYDLWKHVRETIDPNPIVIDTTDLLTNPSKTLRAYLEALGMPYSEKLLTWPASIDELRSWKTAGEGLVDSFYHFYHTAMTSTHFMPPSDIVPRDQLSNDVIRCIDKAMPFYEEMYENRLKL